MMSNSATSRAIRIAVPLSVGLIFLAGWEAIVAIYNIKPFVLPAPSAIFGALIDNWATLMASTWATFKITAMAFLLALVGGVGLAVLFSPKPLAGTRFVPVCRYPTSNTGCRDCALDPDLGGVREH